jgi:hypothetical protein
MAVLLKGEDGLAPRRRRRRSCSEDERLGLEEIRPAEAGVARPAIGIEDLDLGPAPYRTEPVPGDDDLRPLADDISPEPDPGAPGELEAEAEGRLDPRPNRSPSPRPDGGLEEDEEASRPAGEGGQAPDPLGDGDRVRPVEPRASIGTGAGGEVEVEDQEVDEAGPEDRPGEGERLVERRGDEGDEPFQPDPSSDGLDWIEAPRAIDPADDPAGPLDLGGETEGEGGCPARPAPPDGEPTDERNAARPEDRVERREAARHDPFGGTRRPDEIRDPLRARLGHRRGGPDAVIRHAWLARLGGREDGEGALDPPEPLRPEPRRSPSPALLEGDEGIGDGGWEGGHGAIIRTSVLSVKGSAVLIWAIRSAAPRPDPVSAAGR